MTPQHNDHNRGARSGLHLWVALLLALLLVVSWFLGYGPGGSKCAPAADASLGRAAAIQSAAPSAGPAVAAAPAPTVAPMAAPTAAPTPVAPASAEATVAASPVAATTVAAPAAPVQTEAAAASPRAATTSPAVATTTTSTTTPAPPPPPATVATPEPSPAPTAVAPAVPVAKVYFAVEQASLPKNAGRALARVVTYLKANPQAKASVSGFHDPSGNLANNENLAMRRAQAVARAMQKMGIAKQRIVLQNPEKTLGSGSAAEARRVEVGVASP